MGKGRIGWSNGPDIRQFLGWGKKHPGKNAKHRHKKQYSKILVARSSLGKKFQIQRRFGGEIPLILQICPELPRRCPGDVPEMSRRIPGRPPHTASFGFRKFVVFFCYFSRFWSKFLIFVFCVFLVFLRLGTEKFVAFNPICKFHLFFLQINQFQVFFV